MATLLCFNNYYSVPNTSAAARIVQTRAQSGTQAQGAVHVTLQM